jgi:small nuclear ribonucleoprotein D3
MPTSVGVPIKLLHEAEGHRVTVELVNGEQYRGTLSDAQDNMNVQLRQVVMRARDGSESKLDLVFIRGSKIRFLILPDMLKHAPMFKRFDVKNKEAQKQLAAAVAEAIKSGGARGGGRGGRGRGRGGPPGR